jgi:epoxyqueuosine reductase
VKAALQREALNLGFALCRVARCEPPAHAGAFREWLDAGMAGEMAPWLERGAARRMQPADILPGAQSVVVLALNYFQGEPDWRAQSGPDEPARGRIARYAWGDDYHDLISARLRALDALLQSAGGMQRWYVDTGPVLERDHAAAAGIGWHGKSTMLLHPQLGTWTFLAEMLTTLALEPDPPIADRCGKCTRCLDACPTGAIRRDRPHHLDARLCISYLTIEHRGAIPLELRPLLGDRIYGCDDCLDACPWNRFAQASREAAFQARDGVKNLALRDYLRLTDEDFRVLFRGSPIMRAKRRGLLRNVCVALGNVGAPGDLPALEAAASAGDELIAEHAQWAITQIRARAAGDAPV